MRRKYLLVGGSLLLLAFAALLLLFGNVNTSEFSTGVATGAVLTGFGLLAWAIQTAVTEGKEQKMKVTKPPSELEIRLHQFTDIAPERLAVRFDFEVVASREIDALEVQISIGYADIMGEWVNLDLRQYEMVEVEKEKKGQAVRRISLLKHASQRFTFVTFFFRPATPKCTTIKVVDQSKQVNFTNMKWLSPYPRLNAKFVGLENEIEKRYIIVFNKSHEEPVELSELGSDKAKQLRVESSQTQYLRNVVRIPSLSKH